MLCHLVNLDESFVREPSFLHINIITIGQKLGWLNKDGILHVYSWEPTRTLIIQTRFITVGLYEPLEEAPRGKKD